MPIHRNSLYIMSHSVLNCILALKWLSVCMKNRILIEFFENSTSLKCKVDLDVLIYMHQKSIVDPSTTLEERYMYDFMRVCVCYELFRLIHYDIIVVFCVLVCGIYEYISFVLVDLKGLVFRTCVCLVSR